MAVEGSIDPPVVRCTRTDDGTLLVDLSGAWALGPDLPAPDEVVRHFDSGRNINAICFDTATVTSWDTGILTFLATVFEESTRRNIRVNREGLPEGVQRLLHLAAAAPPKDRARTAQPLPVLERIGTAAVAVAGATGNALGFIGKSFLAFADLLRGKARYRKPDLFLFIQECGAQALPIVTLISLLVGLILAFVGAVQLQMFGAQIYVANLVGLGMAREMGAMMTGIIMAGRTGAAFAAQLGTMQVNEEIDAFQTLGVDPMQFLVLPRMLALLLMMPLLCLYADFMGILGGTIVATGLLDISFAQYFEQTCTALHLRDFSLGLIKSVVFGLIVALCGCMQGMNCGRNASAVGQAATSAVVQSIVWIVVFDAALTILYSILGI